MGRFAVQEEDDEQDDQHGNHYHDTSTPSRGTTTIPDAWRSATWSTPSRFSLARAEEEEPGEPRPTTVSASVAEHHHPIGWLSEEEEEDVGGTPFSALVGVNFWKTPPTNPNANDGTHDTHNDHHHHPHTPDDLDPSSEEAEDDVPSSTMSHHDMDRPTNRTNDGGHLYSNVVVRPATGRLYDHPNHEYEVGLISRNNRRKPSSVRRRNVMIGVIFYTWSAPAQ